MDQTLSSFIRALRNADVRISTAETLDAFNAVQLVGYENRANLKRTLSLVLPKTVDEKETFDSCFDRFFSFESVRSMNAADSSRINPDSLGDSNDSGESGEGGNAQGGQGDSSSQFPTTSKTDQTQRAGKGARTLLEDDPSLDEDLGLGEMSEPSSPLGTLLLAGDATELSVAMARAGEANDVSQISVFTQKGLYTRRIMESMGLVELQAEMGQLRSSAHIPDRRLAQELRRRNDALREQVRDYVERQFLLHADVTGKRLREELLRKVKLSNLEQRNFRMIQEVVFRMAKKLVALHSHRRKVHKRGQLHLPKTLRANMSFDGAIFDLKWKSVKIDRPKVFAICDVSGSVANYARFMLMFLYSLEEVMPKVRSFAFSSDLAEVTDLFERNELEDAIAKTLRDYSGGSTDYGQALKDFRKLCLDDLDHRTTVIVLGDARNNYGEAHAEILKEVYDRSKRVLWLNPESRNTWNIGDAEMRKYSAYCHQVEECNSLMHLERIVGNLLQTIQ